MPKKVDFKYTLEEFYQDVISDISEEPTENKKPNIIELLKAKKEQQKPK